MSDEKIIKIPISNKQRIYNSHGQGYVPCKISNRFLQFEETYCESNNYVFVDVMTNGYDENPKKICNLCIDLNDLKNAISKLKPR